jgi:hypothetical protein
MKLWAFRLPLCERIPDETGVGSEKACSGRWQEAQETEPSAESLVS